MMEEQETIPQTGSTSLAILPANSEKFVERSYADFDTLDNECANFESLVGQIIAKTQNTDRRFFHVMVAYYAGLVAAMLQTTVKSATRGNIPCGNYCIAMAPSGFGKGYSQSLLEKSVVHKFLYEFTHFLFEDSFERHVAADATNLARRKRMDPATVEEKIRTEFDQAGPFLPIFDSATKAAIRQQRSKILAAHAGSLNLVMDEAGSNLSGSMEELSSMLELYDTGALKEKLIKNTKENKRAMGREGVTPATMLLFGTPTKVFDGGRIEQEFMDLMQTGYARRCLFGWGTEVSRSGARNGTVDIEKKYNQLLAASDTEIWETFADHLFELAVPDWMHKRISLDKHEELILLNYQLECENEARKLNEFAELEKIELVHRHSKALKLAGSLAVFEGQAKITENTLLAAIKIVQESGKAFGNIVNRERNYATLARFLAAQKEPQTLADLSEKLPFFKTGYGARREQLDLASAWGRTQFITIDREVVDGIEMFQGHSLGKTDIENIPFSISETMAAGYEPLVVGWDKIGKLLTLTAGALNPDAESPGTPLNFCTHQFRDQHRLAANAIPGFNVLVFDVDGTATLESVHDVLKDYYFATCTTKSHTAESHRFRVILPINVHLEMDEQKYQLFVRNILSFLPFESDGAAADIARKWLTNPNGQVYVNQSENQKLFDAFPFIPGTNRDDRRKDELREMRKDIRDQSRLVVWFIKKINSDGERNNHLFRLGMMLVENGMGLKAAVNILEQTNGHLDNPLDTKEVIQIGKSIEPRYRAIKQAREAREANERRNMNFRGSEDNSEDSSERTKEPDDYEEQRPVDLNDINNGVEFSDVPF